MAVALICCLAVLSSFVNQGLALKCYECHSVETPSCLDKPPDSLLKPCSSSMTGCITVTSVGRHHEAGMEPTKNVLRNCGTSKSGEGCVDTSNDMWKSSRCYCTADGCNFLTLAAASIPVGANAMMLLTFALLWF